MGFWGKTEIWNVQYFGCYSEVLQLKYLQHRRYKVVIRLLVITNYFLPNNIGFSLGRIRPCLGYAGKVFRIFVFPSISFQDH